MSKTSFVYSICYSALGCSPPASFVVGELRRRAETFLRSIVRDADAFVTGDDYAVVRCFVFGVHQLAIFFCAVRVRGSDA